MDTEINWDAVKSLMIGEYKCLVIMEDEYNTKHKKYRDYFVTKEDAIKYGVNISPIRYYALVENYIIKKIFIPKDINARNKIKDWSD